MRANSDIETFDKYTLILSAKGPTEVLATMMKIDFTVINPMADFNSYSLV